MTYSKYFYWCNIHIKTSPFHPLNPVNLKFLSTKQSNFSFILFQYQIPNRRKSELLQTFEKYQKEESEKQSTPKNTSKLSPFSNEELNTPLLQRLAMKQFNESQGGSPALKKSTPKTKSSTLKPSTGFTLEMSRKPTEYLYLYFLPSGFTI